MQSFNDKYGALFRRRQRRPIRFASYPSGAGGHRTIGYTTRDLQRQKLHRTIVKEREDARCRQRATEKMQIATDSSSSDADMATPMQLCSPGFDAPPWVRKKPPLAPRRTYSYNAYGGWP